MRLKDSIAVLAGGGGSIGSGIAVRLAHEGATIVVADLDQEAAKRVVQRVEAAGSEGRAVRLARPSQTNGD